ncbi:hypothetical protein ABIA06_003158 [Bradyrhizobium yuanmingense]
MSFADTYRKQVALLLRVLPFVTDEKCFALKGGTAINLFVRDLPRQGWQEAGGSLPTYAHHRSSRYV